jgi:Protein of unknown function (DUF3450)
MGLSRQLVLVLLVAFSLPCLSETSVDGLMQKWIQLESQKGKLQMEWAERKSELERRQQLLETEKSALSEVVSQTEVSTSDMDQHRKTLLTDQEQLEQEQSLLTEQINQAVLSIQSFQYKLPPPLADEVGVKMGLLDTNLSQSEKLERLLSIFKLIDEFNQRVAIHKATIDLAANNDEAARSIRVTQIYLGLSQGWYLSEDASEYGYGRATQLGWKWWSKNELEAELGRELDPQEIKNMIAIIENPTLADLVSLPIKLESKGN